MRPHVPIAGGITLIVVGAIFKFAITTRPVQGIDLSIVGVILMLAGLAALLLPVLTHNRTRVVSLGRGRFAVRRTRLGGWWVALIA